MDASGGLSQALSRTLCDGRYEKRKQAALEIESSIKQLMTQGKMDTIKRVLDQLVADFAYSASANNRKGGLIGLAALAVGMSKESASMLPDILPPVLHSFNDQDPRVRYYACESVYNICKVARGGCMPLFEPLFDAICKLVADGDANVRNAAQLLDRLLKDIVAEEPGALDLPYFMPVLRDRARAPNPYVRQFLMSWVMTLDSLPGLGVLAHLPALLDSFLDMLQDPASEIRHSARQALTEFAQEIMQGAPVDMGSMTRTLIRRYQQDAHLSTTKLAVEWLDLFLSLDPSAVRAYYPDMVRLVLETVGHSDEEVQGWARGAGERLMACAGTIPAEAVHEVIAAVAAKAQAPEGQPSALAALRWMEVLITAQRAGVMAMAGEVVPALTDALLGPDRSVARASMAALAKVAAEEPHFSTLLASVTRTFKTADNGKHLKTHGTRILGALVRQLGPEKVLRRMAALLLDEHDTQFVSLVVQALNFILLTSGDLRPLRAKLRQSGAGAADGQSLFEALLPCWTCSFGAAMSLCLLCERYALAASMVQAFETREVPLPVFTQADRLVSMLETPVFTFLRLHLTEGRPDLLAALQRLLAVLPQSDAFR